MKAKEYLRSIRTDRKKIDKLKAKAIRLRRSLELTAVTYDKDRIQTTPSDRTAETIGEIAELDKDIKKLQDGIETMHKQMQSLENNTQATLLSLVYYWDLPLKECAEDMCYSYDRIKHIHGDALRAFEKKFLGG